MHFFCEFNIDQIFIEIIDTNRFDKDSKLKNFYIFPITDHQLNLAMNLIHFGPVNTFLSDSHRYFLNDHKAFRKIVEAMMVLLHRSNYLWHHFCQIALNFGQESFSRSI